jgi:hypothetical protein
MTYRLRIRFKNSPEVILPWRFATQQEAMLVGRKRQLSPVLLSA